VGQEARATHRSGDRTSLRYRETSHRLPSLRRRSPRPRPKRRSPPFVPRVVTEVGDARPRWRGRRWRHRQRHDHSIRRLARRPTPLLRCPSISWRHRGEAPTEKEADGSRFSSRGCTRPRPRDRQLRHLLVRPHPTPGAHGRSTPTPDRRAPKVGPMQDVTSGLLPVRRPNPGGCRNQEAGPRTARSRAGRPSSFLGHNRRRGSELRDPQRRSRVGECSCVATAGHRWV